VECVPPWCGTLALQPPVAKPGHTSVQAQVMLRGELSRLTEAMRELPGAVAAVSQPTTTMRTDRQLVCPWSTLCGRLNVRVAPSFLS
jgi:hypothetical protein